MNNLPSHIVGTVELADFAIEELEIRLEMAVCCTDFGCNAYDWKGFCTQVICKTYTMC